MVSEKFSILANLKVRSDKSHLKRMLELNDVTAVRAVSLQSTPVKHQKDAVFDTFALFWISREFS